MTTQKSHERLTISVTGLGYVGLPAALAFATKYRVIGFDHSKERVDMLLSHDDPSGEIPHETFNGLNITFTSNAEDLRLANFHIVAVPTPVDDSRTPDITLLKKAMETVGERLKKGDTVVIESTVYPGCVEEDCQPILEAKSGLKANADFNLGYSPERINPGDKRHTFTTVRKIVSAGTPEGLDRIAAAYQSVISAEVFRASSIRVAEAAKVIENTQRDVNIALMNELAMIFNRMGIETDDVLRAAATKWNFMPFHPGLVGGHCIGVDPYYLDYKARKIGYHTQIISHGRAVNDSMGRLVATETVRRMLTGLSPDLTKTRVLIMGMTYKEDVRDVRNTRSVDIITELSFFGISQIDVMDPIASKRDSETLYGITPKDQPDGIYDAIVVATSHSCFKSLRQDFFDSHLREGGVLSDVYGIFRDIDGFKSWRL